MLVAESISNGFKEVFGELINRIMCWSHTGRKWDDRLARISDKEIRANMRTDLYSLKLARNSQIFDKASKLFLLIFLVKKILFGGKKKFVWGKKCFYLGVQKILPFFYN